MKTMDELPERYTHADLKAANEKHWDQRHAFADPFAGVAPSTGTTTSKSGSRNTSPVSPDIGGPGRAEVPRATLAAQGQAGPIGMGQVTALEKGEPRMTQAGLKPLATGESDGGAKISHAELASYSARPDRNYGGIPMHPRKQPNPFEPAMTSTVPPSGPKTEQK
jgi:hypothetical protein